MNNHPTAGIVIRYSKSIKNQIISTENFKIFRLAWIYFIVGTYLKKTYFFNVFIKIVMFSSTFSKCNIRPHIHFFMEIQNYQIPIH